MMLTQHYLLSDVLMRYYPLVGRIKDNLIVDCKDEAVLYYESQVKCQPSDIVPDPNPTELKKFLPFDIDAHALQLTKVPCIVNHKNITSKSIYKLKQKTVPYL